MKVTVTLTKTFEQDWLETNDLAGDDNRDHWLIELLMSDPNVMMDDATWELEWDTKEVA